MQEITIKELIQQIAFYSICNSFVVFGLLKTIKSITEKEKLNKWISIGITYAIGFVMGYMLYGDIPIWQKFIHGFFIASCSVAGYEAAIKSMLEIIPTIVERFFGNNNKKEP